MNGYEERIVTLPIYIDSATPSLCNQPSTRYQGAGLSPNRDGCEAFYRDDTGQGHCGAFDECLEQFDDEENDEYAKHYRCLPCLKNEIRTR